MYDLSHWKEFLIGIIPVIVAVGSLITTLFVKAFNAKNNVKALKEEMISIKAIMKENENNFKSELAKKDLIISELKAKLKECELLITQYAKKLESFSTGNESEYVKKLEEVNEELRKNAEALQKQNKTLSSQSILYNDEINSLEVQLMNKKQEIENLNNEISELKSIKLNAQEIIELLKQKNEAKQKETEAKQEEPKEASPAPEDEKVKATLY
ncbi:hypothetical protein [Mycoplasma tauri]|uniref:hypothetical protein n=1 Tax=Mycoplasma tauri TaxID=547987 RepID=UPI001CBC33BD|nr:hypothetical protein [Mycoplasma tauri]MBZ4203406.1 hypothetical protein [Mycoplasma tauri]